MTDLPNTTQDLIDDASWQAREAMVPPREPTTLETSITAVAALAVGGYLVAKDRPESRIGKIADIPLRIVGAGILAVGASAGSKVMVEGLQNLPKIGTVA